MRMQQNACLSYISSFMDLADIGVFCIFPALFYIFIDINEMYCDKLQNSVYEL